MSRDGYLPPGVTSSMIPGNRLEDVAFDKFLEEKLKDCYEEFYDNDEENGYIKYFDEKDEEFRNFVRKRFKEYYRSELKKRKDVENNDGDR